MIHSVWIYNKLFFLTSYQLFSAYWLLTYSHRCLRTSYQPFKLVKVRSSNPKASKPIWSEKCVLKCYSVKAGLARLLLTTPFITRFTNAVISVSSRQSIGRLSINFRFRKPQSNTPRRRSSREYSVHYVASVERERGRERVPHRSYNYGFRARFVFPPSTAIRAATPVGRADTRAVIKGGRQHTQVRRSTTTLSSSVHFLSNTLHTCPQQTHADTHTKKSNYSGIFELLCL